MNHKMTAYSVRITSAQPSQMIDWCADNIPVANIWYNPSTLELTLYFNNEEDATIFKMVAGGEYKHEI